MRTYNSFLLPSSADALAAAVSSATRGSMPCSQGLASTRFDAVAMQTYNSFLMPRSADALAVAESSGTQGSTPNSRDLA